MRPRVSLELRRRPPRRAVCLWYSASIFRNLQPILQPSCVRCYSAGSPGSGNFTDLSAVDVRAPAMLGTIDGGRVPPPVSNPDSHVQVGLEDRLLPAASRDVLADWIDQGQVLADPLDAATPEVIETDLTTLNHVVSLPEPDAPPFEDAANFSSDYRCVALDPGEALGQSIKVLAPIVDEVSLVHHGGGFPCRPPRSQPRSPMPRTRRRHRRVGRCDAANPHSRHKGPKTGVGRSLVMQMHCVAVDIQQHSTASGTCSRLSSVRRGVLAFLPRSCPVRQQ